MKNILAERAVLAQLNINQFSTLRIDKQATEEVHRTHKCEDKSGSYKKHILKSDTLRAINELSAYLRQYHDWMTLWWDRGTGILPSVNFEAYMKHFRQHVPEFEGLVDKFIKEYPALVEAMKVPLNGLWRADDYPPAEVVRSKFGIHLHILPVPDISAFKQQNQVVARLAAGWKSDCSPLPLTHSSSCMIVC